MLFCAECGRPTPSDELARFGDLLVCPACKDAYAQKLREGVTRAVPVRYAGFWIRVVATIIDSIILMFVGGIIQYASLGTVVMPTQIPPGTPPEEIFLQLFRWIGAASAVSTFVNALYEALFVYYLAATPGKLALGLKIVRPDGSRIGLGRAFGRHFAKILSGLILGIGYLIVAFDSQKRGLHDMICDTRVIRVRDL